MIKHWIFWGLIFLAVGCASPERRSIRIEAEPKRVEPGEEVRLHYSYEAEQDGARLKWVEDNRKYLDVFLERKGSGTVTKRPKTGKEPGDPTIEYELSVSQGSVSSVALVKVYPKLDKNNVIWALRNGPKFTPGDSVEIEYRYKGTDSAIVKEDMGAGFKEIEILQTNNGEEVRGTYRFEFKQPADYLLKLDNKLDGTVLKTIRIERAPQIRYSPRAG